MDKPNKSCYEGIGDGSFISDEYLVAFAPGYIVISEHYIRILNIRYRIIKRDVPCQGYWVEREPESVLEAKAE